MIQVAHPQNDSPAPQLVALSPSAPAESLWPCRAWWHVIVAVVAVCWVCSSNWLKAMYIIPKRGKVDKVDWNKDLLGVSPCSLSSDVEASNFEAKSLEHGLVAVHTHHQMPMRKLDRGGVRSGWCQCELSKRVDTPLTWNLVIRCN